MLSTVLVVGSRKEDLGKKFMYFTSTMTSVKYNKLHGPQEYNIIAIQAEG